MTGSVYFSDHTWHIHLFMFNIMSFSHLKLCFCMAGNLLVSDYLKDQLRDGGNKVDTGKMVCEHEMWLELAPDCSHCGVWY